MKINCMYICSVRPIKCDMKNGQPEHLVQLTNFRSIFACD